MSPNGRRPCPTQACYRAIELDPDFAVAYGMAARCYSQRKSSGWVEDRARDITEAARLAMRAAELGKDDALALCTAGIALHFVVGNQKDGEALIERALALNPNLAWAWLFSGWVKVWSSEPEVGIDRLRRSLRLSPNDPHSFNMYSAMAAAHFFAGRYSEAVSWAEMASRERPNYLLPRLVAAASNALTGHHEDAQKAMAQARLINPALRIPSLRDLYFASRPEHAAKWEEGLRLAGLPE